MAYCEFCRTRGLAAFLHSVRNIESAELPAAGPTACTEAEYTKLYEIFKNSGPGLFHQVGLTCFHALREFARNTYHAAESTDPATQEPSDCVSALRNRVHAQHHRLLEFLIAHQQHLITKLKLDEVCDQSPVETIVKTLAALEPLAQALHALNPTHQASKDAAGNKARLRGYLPQLQRESEVRAAIERLEPGATLPQGFEELSLDALQALLTPQRVAATQAAYRTLAEIHGQHSASDAKALAGQALILLATASALLTIQTAKEGADAFAARALTPRGLTLSQLPPSVAERLWQIESELQAVAQLDAPAP